ncbi:Metallo-dependent phosphatase [Sistotremastrum suecicum HHB10207 ss-3]|uniref:Metallo-dependent phosphatase n=1 Tax=Sistotremastrum suecicum HHB10207 ss-3 TaxID=1314776 RepID=A0A165Z040_9AGAM|nr:Metallo-dependent phosphatase [Sistotremastrum suecicum HHB10207 ss-3]
MFSWFIISAVLAFVAQVSARPALPNDQESFIISRLDPYPAKPKLSFRPDGTFKISVFSDLHYGENPAGTWGRVQDFNSTRLLTNMLASEKPDYVVINGDLITGESAFSDNSTKLYDQIMAPLILSNVPFSCTYGNHDNQVNISHIEELQHEVQVAPQSYTRASPSGVGGKGGPANYWVPIYFRPSDPVPSLILWFFDSRGGYDERDVPIPDWVDDSVAGWIEEETHMMNKVWGKGEERGSLVFMHIPPHAVQKLQANLTDEANPGLNDDDLGEGSVQSTVPPLSACRDECDRVFWDSLTSNIKNVHAIVSGHDHGNEWCAVEPSKGVVFCFDKHSGYGGYDADHWNHGVRNFLFTSANASDGVESWIQYETGESKARVRLRGSDIYVEGKTRQ